MLYLDFAKNREDFILEKEEKLPNFIKNILYHFRKFAGQVIFYELDGKRVVLISKINKKTFKNLDKIFKIDVTKNVCVCDYLMENENFSDFLKSRNLKILDGKWLFKYLICDISEFICKKLEMIPENNEISLLIDDPDLLTFDTIKNLSQKFKNINIITTKIGKFRKIEEEITSETGLILNITNNFKRACLKSKIVFNFDFDEKNFSKIIFMPSAFIVNLDRFLPVKQSNFVGKNIDFYSINLPIKYKKVYDRLNKFNSSVLYESFIYKRTSNQNIWNEIEKDNIEILLLESEKKRVFC